MTSTPIPVSIARKALKRLIAECDAATTTQPPPAGARRRSR